MDAPLLVVLPTPEEAYPLVENGNAVVVILPLLLGQHQALGRRRQGTHPQELPVTGHVWSMGEASLYTQKIGFSHSFMQDKPTHSSCCCV